MVSYSIVLSKKWTLQAVVEDHQLLKMGNGMNKILPGLYVGNFRDAKDEKQLEENNITHIVSIHDNAKKILDSKEYLCILASDCPSQDLTKYFPQVTRFIHKARLEGGGVLVHCLAGVSRSVTVTAAYIMTVTDLGWRDALNSIRGARSVANPNFGFQKQLQSFEHEFLGEERKKVKQQFAKNTFRDEEDCRANLKSFQHYLNTGSLPARNDNLYPLPHQAYQGHAKREAESALSGAKETDKSDRVDKGQTSTSSSRDGRQKKGEADNQDGESPEEASDESDRKTTVDAASVAALSLRDGQCSQVEGGEHNQPVPPPSSDN